MSLAELMPAVKSLSRTEKVELKRMLDSELSDRPDPIAEQAAPDEDLLRQLVIAAQFHIPRPGESYEAAAILSQMLEAEKAKAR